MAWNLKIRRQTAKSTIQAYYGKYRGPVACTVNPQMLFPYEYLLFFPAQPSPPNLSMSIMSAPSWSSQLSSAYCIDNHFNIPIKSCRIYCSLSLCPSIHSSASPYCISLTMPIISPYKNIYLFTLNTIFPSDLMTLPFKLGTAVAQGLRCCATNCRWIFHWHKILPIVLRPWSWISQ